MESEWVELSLAGDLDGAARVQYRLSREARTEMNSTPEPEDYLPVKRVPAPPCPGFERLCKIMEADKSDIQKTLASYKPIWSSHWARTLTELSEELD